MTRFIILALAIAAMTVATLMMVSVPARAQQAARCGNTAAIAEELASRFGEYPMATGSFEDGERMLLTANPDTGTWTALIVKPGGVSCMASAGIGFEVVAPKPNL
jgi:hypothetical protein